MPCFSIMGMDSICSKNSGNFSSLASFVPMLWATYVRHETHTSNIYFSTSVLGPQGPHAPVRGAVLFQFKHPYCKRP